MTQTWTARECAEAWGVQEPTWVGYVSRGAAPPALPGDGPRRWDADTVRAFPRPGAGRSRAAANPEAAALVGEMTARAARIAELRGRQPEVARAARDAGAETRSIARASGVSPQTVYGWLG
ncbi:MAG: hypothetical protein L0I24_05105 [Pseudonocardia sp.]|nr:hypothetical protein [Pseudonocardia sp.]